MKLISGILVIALAVTGCTQIVGGDPLRPKTSEVVTPVPEAAEGPCPEAADLTEVISPGTFSFGPGATNIQVTGRVGVSSTATYKSITSITGTGNVELFVRPADNDASGTLIINNSRRTVYLKSKDTCPQRVRSGEAFVYEGVVELAIFVP